jgi:hypothetical protein
MSIMIVIIIVKLVKLLKSPLSLLQYHGHECSLNVGALEVHTVLIAEKFWGFSSEYSGIYLGCINLLAVPFGLIPVASYVQDNKGMLFGATLLLAINPMFWDYGLETVSASATLFGFGALILLISAQFLKAFSWGLVS